MWLCIHFPFSLLVVFYLVWTCASLVHGVTDSVSSHMHQHWCVWMERFSEGHLWPLPLTIFWAHLSYRTLSFEGRSLINDIPFRNSASKSITFCTLSTYGSLSLSDYSKKKLFWWELSDVLVYRCNIMLSSGIFLLWSFNGITLVDFPLGPQTYVVWGSLPP